MSVKEFDKLHSQSYVLNEIDKAVIAYSEDVYGARIDYDVDKQIIWIKIEQATFRIHCSCPEHLAIYHRNHQHHITDWHKQFGETNFKNQVHKAIATCILYEWSCDG